MISKVKQSKEGGYPVVRFEWDGQPAIISTASTRAEIWREIRAVYVGEQFDNDKPVTLPADPNSERAETELPGYTQNGEIVNLFEQMLTDNQLTAEGVNREP